MRKVLLLVAMFGAVACGGEKTPAATTVGDAAVDSATVDSATDAAVDSLATADAMPDTADAEADVPDVIVDSPYFAWCKAYRDQMMLARAKCGCASSMPPQYLSMCMMEFGSSVLDAAVGGDVVLDAPMDATCTASIKALASACTEAAYGQVNCTLAWFDTAKIGEGCHAAGPLVCGGGQGLCVVVQPPDGFKCFAAGGQGDACSATQPCRVGLACLEGALTRAKTCGVPGSTCNLSDKCREGFKCEGGACKVDPSAPKSICTP